MVGDPHRRRSDRELIELNARTLFTHDDAGHLVAINERGGKAAPRLFLAWTASELLWRVRGDLPAALIARIAGLIAGAVMTGDLDRPPDALPAMLAALAAHTPIADDHNSGPEYVFPDDIAAPLGAVAVTEANAGVLARWLPEWLPDVTAGLPMRAVLVDGHAVSVCGCARIPGEATHAGVETHAAFRGRGHAVTVTASWARAMRERGVVPLYGTSTTNRASQRVAAKLGLIRYGTSLGVD